MAITLQLLQMRQVINIHNHFYNLPVFRLIPKLWSCKGSKSQNCLCNTIIGGLTSNLKERPKLTINNDPRPPEEILADELPPVDSPEALVKTSFRTLPGVLC
ncbi:dual specificity calcium/calmodulin-dependent 3',5'-cyclic nucleotide phosphodiesterase 1C-like isoform X2 [Poecile atricapillus]|uniref:dual specificity calcium/calmodulin-dependent 3',5'-cyclic nucleotide phosphodiesterase 1C-like isoform X2 n=1 Tax=Poecile atricapillus TaxID=48891 RepID=UPI002738AF68|nr:dual specificity calcium/calmodulin-dependent 3',5'-cyclic nucleotide phosphodiesterase 1C-like isoform X2 [Poecile atricapillus]